MKKLLLILMCALLYSFAPFQSKKFACLPCGQDCDNQEYTKGGECPMCMMKLVDKSTFKFKNLSVDQFCNQIAANNKVILLDVRSPQEFNGTIKDKPSFGHFKGAININVTELESRVGELAKYQDSEVLVYCSHSHRSPQASYFLTTHGFRHVSNMSGGVSTITDSQRHACLKKSYVPHAN